MNFGTSQSIVLDLYHNRYVAAEVAQYDINSRELIITITNKGKFYKIEDGIIVRIKYLKSDGKMVLNDCDILDDGTVKIEFTEQMTIAAGRCEAELMLLKSDTQQILHSMHFVVNVINSVFSDGEIVSTNEFVSLENALLKVEEASKRAEEFTELTQQVEINEEIRKENEITRNKNEETRMSNEDERIKSENTRVESETQRNTDENIRKENELARIANENNRENAESKRQENEVFRVAEFEDMKNTVENGKAYADSKEMVSSDEPANQVAGDFWLLEY